MTESDPLPVTAEPPVTAEADLQTLCSTLHLDAPVVQRFVADYLRLLPSRLDRIDSDLARGDLPAATVDLLSLATSSTMLGASDVTEAAEQLRERSASGNPAAVDASRLQLISRVEQAKLRLARISVA
ncbi:hypothetical protein [Microlunatus soli]|uniref:Hpt domain-containing protein n=1 Tax=Microlunatus soli TaxID=630515 RepID=A0A1H1TAQ8_9ACTN|nr:hypothetical protein [Microlunatus soli]SDS57076.1 hypothetical protein SAMN04489812_2314 [Microlunatus soli]